MNLYNISFQSLRRRKARTAFLLIGLTLAVASFVALYVVADNVNRSVASNLDEFGANIVIVPGSDGLNFNYGGVNIADLNFNNRQLKNEDIEKIKSIKNKDNLSIIAPKLLNPAVLNGENIFITGVNFTEEMRLKKWWQLNGDVPENSEDAVIGSEIAKVLKLNINQKININGSLFTVKGILNETGSQDDALIFIDLYKAQKLFNKTGELTLIEIAARCYDCPIEEITRQVSSKLPGAKVTAIKQTILSKMNAVHKFEHFSFGISVVILIIALLIVFSSINASVNERAKEIGIFMAVGFRRWHIIKVILIEVFAVSLTAGIIGFAAGIVVSKFVAPALAMEADLQINFSFMLLIISALIAVTAGMMAAIYPALRASRLDPTIALRSL